MRILAKTRSTLKSLFTYLKSGDKDKNLFGWLVANPQGVIINFLRKLYSMEEELRQIDMILPPGYTIVGYFSHSKDSSVPGVFLNVDSLEFSENVDVVDIVDLISPIETVCVDVNVPILSDLSLDSFLIQNQTVYYKFPNQSNKIVEKDENHIHIRFCLDEKSILKSLTNQLNYIKMLSVKSNFFIFYSFHYEIYAHPFFLCFHPQIDLSVYQDRFFLNNLFLYPYQSKEFKTSRLSNPHTTLKKGNYVVPHAYEYYHYNQDSFIDSGWGCAYRSLQTIISYYQGIGKYYDECPTIPMIQKILVDVKDKKSSFVGSKEWIGAFEGNLVLEHLMGFASRIIRIDRGSDVVTKSRDFANHFSTVGTPILIGGGVLAYTMLGIDWNEKTGDVKYLILDPHYVGADSLEIILKKQWCAWRDRTIFLDQHFYNFLLPQLK